MPNSPSLPQEKYNLLFSSTTVSNGACLACVVATGMSTEIGKIQAAVTKAGEDRGSCFVFCELILEVAWWPGFLEDGLQSLAFHIT
jgi:magnesium-transporting ATPase (P-type)